MTFLALSILAVLLIPDTMRELDKAWKATPAGRYRRRAGIVLAAALSVCSPYLVWKTQQTALIFGRVPKPLYALWLDYRVNKSWGFGLPGDNQTGFVVYRLTSGSTEWPRAAAQRWM